MECRELEKANDAALSTATAMHQRLKVDDAAIKYDTENVSVRRRR
jgi:hypothetical protein